MSANVDGMLREGINAYKSGRKEDARVLLLKVTELDQYNEQAWLWLSGLMDTPEDQRTCLENVLAINPNNERAKQGLSYLTGQTSAGNVSPFAAASSSPPPAPSPTVPNGAPTSVEWAAPEEPSAATPAWNRPPPVEPTPAALDDWVSNLNLQSGETGSGSTPAFSIGSEFQPLQTSPFGDFDLNEDDNSLVSGPFGVSDSELDQAIAPSAPARRSPPPQSEVRMSPAEGTRRARPAPARDASARYEMESASSRIAPDNGISEMFGYIPPEIVATRLPGTRERAPILLMLGVIVLILFNLVLAVVVMLTLLT